MHLGPPSNILLHTSQSSVPTHRLLITDNFGVATELPLQIQQLEKSPQRSTSAEERRGTQSTVAPLSNTQALWGTNCSGGSATFQAPLQRLKLSTSIPKQRTNYLQISIKEAEIFLSTDNRREMLFFFS